ncbi:MAG: hypothetical protein PVF47_19810 [Anaerolineae bacterium]|jgi:hypothetical protein
MTEKADPDLLPLYIPFYFDEDVSVGIVQNLRLRGFDVINAREVRHLGLDDEVQWTFIPWEDVLDLVVWPNPMRPIRVVLVRELTPAHLVLSIIYAHWLKPGFLIMSSIDRYHDLMRVIKSRTGLT